MDDVISGAPLGHRVTAVLPTDNHELILTFTNGEQRIFDARPLLDIPAFKSLANKSLFKTVKVAYGSVEWPQNIDYCPDTLYLESIAIR